MHYTLNTTKTFNKELRKIQFSNKIYEKYILFIAALLAKNTLPPEAKNHPLKGNHTDCREFHLSGDLLVIYRIITMFYNCCVLAHTHNFFDE